MNLLRLLLLVLALVACAALVLAPLSFLLMGPTVATVASLALMPTAVGFIALDEHMWRNAREGR